MFTTQFDIKTPKESFPIYQLQPNSKIMLIKNNGKIKIYQKQEFLNSDNSLVAISKREWIYLEELPESRKNYAQLLVISYKDKILNECIIDFYELKLNNFSNQNKKRVETKTMPSPVSSSYYLYQDQNNEYCFIDKSGNVLEIEKEAKEFLKRNNLKLNQFEIKYFDPKKNPNILEVILQIEEVETLHFYLKIEDKIKVFKTFVSEMSGSKEYTLLAHNSEEDYIDFISKRFWHQLINRSLREEIEYIKEFQIINQEKQKNKIRYKIREKIIEHNQ